MVGAPIRQVAARAYEVPTDTPEVDGTLSWDHTTLVVVHVDAGAPAGLGYMYADASLVGLIHRKLARVLFGTGLLDVGALSAARHLSGRCAPAAHLPVACAIPQLRHVEWFDDHVRIEHMLFEGTSQPRHGAITPDLTRFGLGLALKACDAERFRVR